MPVADRMADERLKMRLAMKTDGFRLLMDKMDSFADTLPLEITNLLLNEKDAEAKTLAHVYKAYKIVIPQKMENIVNFGSEEKSFSFRKWLKQAFGG